jgi:hypothetical protein
VRAESDSEIRAAQDQALQTKYRATKVSQTDQTVPDYISMPSTGTITVRKQAWYSVCVELYFNTCKEIGVQSDNEQRYDHVPKLVETGHEGTVTIVWGQQVQTDTTIPDNKPNI